METGLFSTSFCARIFSIRVIETGKEACVPNILMVREMATIAFVHHIQLRRGLYRDEIRDAIRVHVCSERCGVDQFQFLLLKKPREHIKPCDHCPPVLMHDAVARVRTADLRRRRQHRRTQIEEKGEQPHAVDDDDVFFPPLRSFDEDIDVIHEWQTNMSSCALSMGVCAVCAQVVRDDELVDVVPSDLMLDVLRNDCVPERASPHSYAFHAYHRALLCPRGMRDVAKVAAVRLCHACSASLCSNSPRQPKDA